MEDESSRTFWVIATIIILSIAGLVVAGFATGTLEIKKGQSQQEKCEAAGGIYIRGFSDSCAFPPKSN